MITPRTYAIGSRRRMHHSRRRRGRRVVRYEYSSFGEVILSSGDFALSNPFRFSSEYADDAHCKCDACCVVISTVVWGDKPKFVVLSANLQCSKFADAGKGFHLIPSGASIDFVDVNRKGR